MGSFQNLPPSDLVPCIAKYTTSKDVIVLKAVCSAWKSALEEENAAEWVRLNQQQQLPWLMLPGEQPYCYFYSLSEEKLYKVDLPEAYTHRLCGTSNGWLMAVDETPEVFLLNPMTRSRVELPPITTFPYVLGYEEHNTGEEYTLVDLFGVAPVTYSRENIKHIFLHKLALSGDPSVDKDYIAMVLIGPGSPAFYKAGEGDDGTQQMQWTCLRGNKMVPPICFRDVIYCKERKIFYALGDHGGILISCDLNGAVPVVEQVVMSREGDEHYRDYNYIGTANYLALSSSSKEPLMVIRSADWDADYPGEKPPDQRPVYFYRTTLFEIYKLEDRQGRRRWTRVQSIGDDMLFLGINATTCISCSSRDFPRRTCKGNHVYYTDNNVPAANCDLYGGHDLGIRNLLTNELQMFPGCSEHDYHISPNPLWLTPSFR